jgi:hypothetical protein
MKNTALIIALDRGLFKVFSFLTSDPFINFWNTKDLKSTIYTLLSHNQSSQCISFLQSPLAQNIYLLTYTPNQKHLLIKNNL